MATAARHESEIDTGTRRLLALGIAAGPLYLGVGLVQALLRDGFDLARHPLSLLALGPFGWVQVANLVVSGILVIGAAWGLHQALRPRARAVRWTLGAFGASMVVAALFPADAMDGFPAGTPAGVPETMSSTGLVHFAAGALGFLALAVSCFVVGRALSRRGRVPLARFSYLAGTLVIVGFLAPAVLPSAATAGIWVSVVVGFAWLAVVAARLRRDAGAEALA